MGKMPLEVAEKEFHGRISYSQEGEDLIIAKILEEKSSGFFVDIGAHHPMRFSNTYYFYLKGWRGINVDPLPGTKKLFDQERPEDINIEAGVSEKEQKIKYFMFNDPALNTFSAEEAEKKDGANGVYRIIKTVDVNTCSLATILNNYLPANTAIDLLTIDAEGFDDVVLYSNDWDKYQPKIILIEELRSDGNMIINNSKIYSFLKPLGYKLVSRTPNTSIYQKM